ncbi:hypothetical protein ASG73_03000 [Janibacter sp. Soil728]|nr:hypothetical protein ASG73_03000 [Janibacter sp. Soil728]
MALRLARRDVRRHRGRSLAVLLMVGVPTMLICLGLVVGATGSISPEESVPLTMGPAQASITTSEGHRVAQTANPEYGFSVKDAAAREIPGARPGGTVEMNAAAVGELAGGQALPWTMGQTRARIGDRDLGLDTLAVAEPSRLTGKITLRSGRWPTGADEVLVSPAAVRRGVPDSGSLQLLVDGDERTVQVVGTALSLQSWGASHELLTTTPDAMVDESRSSGWFLMGDRPVTWADVTRLNEYGLAVHSAHVVTHPPTQDQIDPELREMGSSTSDTAQLVALGATLLLIVIALLVGPAFAVGATRQRRTLALAASNGATAGQLRRTVLAQAIVLGGLSALVGALVAVPVGWVVIRVITDRGSPLGPFEVPWWQLGAICAIALVAAILAALVPAQRLTKLDIVGAMRGRVVSAPPSRWLFVLGLVLAGVGGAGVIIGLDRTEYVIALAAILLVLGTLLLVPRILHALGGLAGPLPLPLRLAVRDLARHRTRSAPTVAAVLAGSAALTMGLIGATSDNTQQRLDYLPQTISGEGYMYGGGSTQGQDAIDRAARELPELVITPVHSYGSSYEDAPAASDVPAEPFVTTLPRGCTVKDVVSPDRTPQGDVELAPEDGTGNPCLDLSTGSGSTMSMSTISFMPAADIVRRFDLTGDEARTVTDGGGVLVAGEPDGIVSEGRVALGRGTLTVADETGEAKLGGTPSTSRVPVVIRPQTKDTLARAWQSGLVLPTEAAVDAGWPLTVTGYLLHDPDGPIDTATQERLQQVLGDETYVDVERGFSNPLAIVIAVLIAIFTLVLLVVTLTATALSMAEQERDQATIAAVGGSRRTRRLMVASQTWLLATIGIVLGALVGSFPGITIARALTSEGWDPFTGLQLDREAIIDIPWLPLAIVLVAVPALAALLAGLGIRRTPDLTRRTE